MPLVAERGTKEIIRYIKGEVGRTLYRAQRRRTWAECQLQIWGSCGKGRGVKREHCEFE